MSWLFKDPVVIMKEIMSCLRMQLTVAWLNLTMPNQIVKDGLLVYLLAIFILQNFKKFLRRIQSYDVPFLGPKWLICPEQKNFCANIIITFIYLSALSIVQIFKKFL